MVLPKAFIALPPFHPRQWKWQLLPITLRTLYQLADRFTPQPSLRNLGFFRQIHQSRKFLVGEING